MARARIGEVLGETEHGDIIRRVDSVTRGDLAPGRARWSGWYVDGSPQDAYGIRTEELALPTVNGRAPAWVTRAGDGTRWAVLVHGRGARRGETLRAVPVLTDLGISCIIPSYRNDSDGPASSDGKYALGLTEWEDVDLALEFALREGARSIDLLGWSMGGAIVMQVLARSGHAGAVRRVVLDGPVLDWADVMAHHARANRLHPRLAELFATVSLELRAGRPRAEALKNMARKSGVPEIQSFATLVVQSDKLGASIGTALAAEKLARVLTNDPGMGVIRHVDAGYDTAENVAAERGVRIPMSEG